MFKFLLGALALIPNLVMAADTTPQQLLDAALKNSVTQAFLAQSHGDVDQSKVSTELAQDTYVRCTEMGSDNNCTASFRIKAEGKVIMAGLIYFEGVTNEYKVIATYYREPSKEMNFDGFLRMKR